MKLLTNIKLFFKNYWGLLKTAYKESGFWGAVWALIAGWFILLFFWGKELK